MKRFEEDFAELKSDTLKYCIKETDFDGEWPDRYKKSIMPYSLFNKDLVEGRDKSGMGLSKLDPPPRFDLVIVDEAHHIRNTDTSNYKAVKLFCDNAEAVLFLTATPIQTTDQNLFVLLNALRPDLVIDRTAFNHMSEPNPFINGAVALLRAQNPKTRAVHDELSRAGSTDWGRDFIKDDPEFQRILRALENGKITDEKRVGLITDIEALHTFDGIINRTRRRDIGEFTIRRPKTVKVEFTPEQKELHDEVMRVYSKVAIESMGTENPGTLAFVMVTISRQVASCIHGLAPFIQDILHRFAQSAALADVSREGDREVPTDNLKLSTPLRREIEMIAKQAKNLPADDPKLKELLKILKDKQERPNNKAMIVSSFRHTLSYLQRNLKGLRAGLIHGGVPDAERLEIRKRFAMPRDNGDALDVLLLSEVGNEGLDYQFCDCIINYDIPWNPMRIEQRIGRIDRKGQKSEHILIFNMITPDTIDGMIYERCMKRIGVFESALGGSEEILGEVATGIQSIVQNFSLTPAERTEQLQQLADNKIRTIQENERLEERQLELFALNKPQDWVEEEISRASSFWLEPKSMQNLISGYLRKACRTEQEYIRGEGGIKTLRISQEGRSALLRDLREIPRRPGQIWRDWDRWLKGGEPHLKITFSSETANEEPEVTFINPLHPLLKQAANSFASSQKPFVSLKV